MTDLVTTRSEQADVVVVGAGPAGSTAAFHLARAGLDVALLEKSSFPREKVCGDGLTPRAVKQLIAMGVPTRPEDGWIRNQGLRIIGGGSRLELRWPDLAAFPDYGLVRPRQDFAALGARTGVPMVEDLGSGALVNLEEYGLPHERTVMEALADGAGLVAFSGDKLLGGPQAGIVVGRSNLIARMRANPLVRALRVDKMTLAALGATSPVWNQPLRQASAVASGFL